MHPRHCISRGKAPKGSQVRQAVCMYVPGRGLGPLMGCHVGGDNNQTRASPGETRSQARLPFCYSFHYITRMKITSAPSELSPGRSAPPVQSHLKFTVVRRRNLANPPIYRCGGRLGPQELPETRWHSYGGCQAGSTTQGSPSAGIHWEF